MGKILGVTEALRQGETEMDETEREKETEK